MITAVSHNSVTLARRGYTRSPFILISWALLLVVAAGLISKRETFLQFALMDGLGPAMEGELSLEGFKLKKQKEALCQDTDFELADAAVVPCMSASQ